MQTKQAITVLSALAQESRLAIYRLLVEHAPDGLVVSAIAERLGVANTTLSFHLKELVHAGLITSRQEGRFIYYAASMAAMDDLIGYLTENCCSQSGESCVAIATPCKPKGMRTTSTSKRRQATT